MKTLKVSPPMLYPKHLLLNTKEQRKNKGEKIADTLYALFLLFQVFQLYSLKFQLDLPLP